MTLHNKENLTDNHLVGGACSANSATMTLILLEYQKSDMTVALRGQYWHAVGYHGVAVYGVRLMPWNWPNWKTQWKKMFRIEVILGLGALWSRIHTCVELLSILFGLHTSSISWPCRKMSINFNWSHVITRTARFIVLLDLWLHYITKNTLSTVTP